MLRVIGDAHGKFKEYSKIAKKAENSVQLGDFGFNESYKWLQQNLPKFSPVNHSFFGGNHDDYDHYYKVPHALGDYGEAKLGDIQFFFIRGAFSIDKKWRRIHEQVSGLKCWWKEEELDAEKMEKAIKMYLSVKPEIMITHDCPDSISKMIGNPSMLRDFGFDPDNFNTVTQTLLEACLNQHQPKLWVFGHYHRWNNIVHKGCQFICLPELEYIDLDPVKKKIFKSNGQSIVNILWSDL